MNEEVSVYDGDMNALAFRAESVSLQGKDASWLFFNETTGVFSGKPEGQDLIRTFLEATDDREAFANSSFYTLVQFLPEDGFRP